VHSLPEVCVASSAACQLLVSKALLVLRRRLHTCVSAKSFDLRSLSCSKTSTTRGSTCTRPSPDTHAAQTQRSQEKARRSLSGSHENCVRTLRLSSVASRRFEGMIQINRSLSRSPLLFWVLDRLFSVKFTCAAVHLCSTKCRSQGEDYEQEALARVILVSDACKLMLAGEGFRR